MLNLTCNILTTDEISYLLTKTNKYQFSESNENLVNGQKKQLSKKRMYQQPEDGQVAETYS
jgi:hypothetical protein